MAGGRSITKQSSKEDPAVHKFIYRAIVTRVVDGDTVDVEIDLGFKVLTRQRVRPGCRQWRSLAPSETFLAYSRSS